MPGATIWHHSGYYNTNSSELINGIDGNFEQKVIRKIRDGGPFLVNSKDPVFLKDTKLSDTSTGCQGLQFDTIPVIITPIAPNLLTE